MLSSKASRILVVDDLADNALLLQILLEAEGYTVDTANSGSSALRKIEGFPPDLVLLDVMMPDMDGYEVARKIRGNSNLPHIPIVLVTAYGEMPREVDLEAAADDLIHKPIDLDQLIERVKNFTSPKSAKS
ncbi:MAG TPA: response regulator [Coleofasciculaceae cyanobacterium]